MVLILILIACFVYDEISKLLTFRNKHKKSNHSAK